METPPYGAVPAAAAVTASQDRANGACVWLTGLSGAGKSTLACVLQETLVERGLLVERLDGDEVRANLYPELGFSAQDRDRNVRRMGWLASRFVRVGAIVLVAAVSPYRRARNECRAFLEPLGPFVEVLVSAPLEICEQRDTKGLYARARAGTLSGLTGIDDPYEEPLKPDVVVRTHLESVTECADRILGALDAHHVAR